MFKAVGGAVKGAVAEKMKDDKVQEGAFAI